MTYSIVARDEDGRMGVAVQTCLMGVGSICPWGRAGVGVVATQAFALPGYGPRLLGRLAAGEPPADALAALLAADEMREHRQVGVLAADGSAAAHTGCETISFAGDVQAEGLSCQANMMARAGVPEAMREGFLAATGALERRLLAAMEAAERAGGDFRGRQSAAMIVVDAAAQDEGWQGVKLDVRVDDDPEPLAALRRLIDIHEAYGLMRESVTAGKEGRVGDAVSMAARACELAPHDQHVAFTAAVLRAHSGDPGPLRDMIDRKPGNRTYVEWLQAHGESQLSDEVLAQLGAQRAP
jgi:uncharacterized Ntn-hydrolase superfamily protein